MTSTQLQAALRAFDAGAAHGFVPTPRYRLRYSQWGDGPPLVIIHGLNDVPRSFVPIMSHLHKSFRCITLSLPEGRDDGAKLHRYRHEHYPLDLVALLDHLHLNTVNLLGSSFGSTIALRTAATFPERVRRVVLQGGFAWRPLNLAEQGLARLGHSWPWRMGVLPLRPRIMRRLEAPAFMNAPEMLSFLLLNSGETPVRAATYRAKILETLDLRPLLPTISQPVLMLGGDRDAIVPRRYEAEVEARLSRVRRVEFPTCGHYPQYTHSPAMAAEIRAFLIPATFPP